jgi:hypothetical protein
MRTLIFLVCFLALSNPIVSAQQYDLVIEGGRVMDPETGLDAVRNVGIRDGKIVRNLVRGAERPPGYPCRRAGGRSRIH